MVLAVADHVEFFGSPDLKNWRKLGAFGEHYGAHGGVWECPDLFSVPVDNTGENKWVLIVNINPGGPNGGSATQYFVGDFDGNTFTCDTAPNITQWLDHGPDNYAGVTWSNAPDDRLIFLGWMSNWDYANVVPTTIWRSACTLPRELDLTRVDGMIRARSKLVPSLQSILTDQQTVSVDAIEDTLDLSNLTTKAPSQFVLKGLIQAGDFNIVLSNEVGQHITFGFDSTQNVYYIDRQHAGRNDFSANFNKIATAPRFSADSIIQFTMVADVSSLELFMDDGLTVMTAIFFPDSTMSQLHITASTRLVVRSLEFAAVDRIWTNQSNK
jgi:fructan beta-fructosidase